jgi:hypothetical protein
LRQRPKGSDDGGCTNPTHKKIDQLLTEARVILPGAQALLGFQLAVVLTRAFDLLPAWSKALHALALGLICLVHDLAHGAGRLS